MQQRHTKEISVPDNTLFKSLFGNTILSAVLKELCYENCSLH